MSHMLKIALIPCTYEPQGPCHCMQGRFNAPHFTGKARVSQYITEKLPGLTAIYPSSAFFYSNFAEWFIPQYVLQSS